MGMETEVIAWYCLLRATKRYIIFFFEIQYKAAILLTHFGATVKEALNAGFLTKKNCEFSQTS